MTTSSTYGVYAIVHRQLHYEDCYSSCCDGASLRSCAVGHRVLPELEVTPPSSLPPLFD